jgi:hypothetical protein
MPDLPLTHHETSKHDSPNETKIKEKQNETIPDSNSNLAKSMTHYNQIKELTTWFLTNPSVQPMNHFHSLTTIDSSAPTFGMPQQTTVSMFGQGYKHTVPSFSMTNIGLIPYILGGNDRTYTNTNDNNEASYSIVAYTGPISLPGRSAGFLMNHAYHNVMRYNTYDQLENDGVGYETPPQFPFGAQLIDMTPSRATTEPCADPNNLTNQLTTILRESFDIEPKGRGASTKKPTSITITNSLTLEAIEFMSFQILVRRMVKPH